jgi:hypothetical protein
VRGSGNRIRDVSLATPFAFAKTVNAGLLFSFLTCLPGAVILLAIITLATRERVSVAILWWRKASCGMRY